MARYLIIGGAGFIGSNLAIKLAQERCEVIVLDNLSTGSLSNLKIVRNKIKFIKNSAANVLKERSIKNLKGIYHFGIPSSTSLYRNNPYFYGEAINEFIKVLELAKRENCKVVYASSSSLYNGNIPPFEEEMPILVKDLYTEARYGMERLSHLYYDWYKVNSIGLRFFSVYGPNEKAKKNFANLITQFLWAVKKGEKPIVYGDGKQTRDFIYVKDVIEACSLSMASPVEHNIFNVGTGKCFSINEMIAILAKILNKKIQARYITVTLKGYVYATLADTSRAEKVLGFKAQHTLEQGIKEIINNE